MLAHVKHSQLYIRISSHYRTRGIQKYINPYIKAMCRVFFPFMTAVLALLTGSSAYEAGSTPPPPFDLQLANSSVWYAAAASCSKEGYPTHVWSGPCEGFEYLGLIYDKGTDTQGMHEHLAKQKIRILYMLIRWLPRRQDTMECSVKHHRFG